ncbi:MAG: hypothetical protein O3A46_11715, partial [Candidatus Poribacteria bacterium]|nr:hypothetical protein [Candidatus Poribacteria bacterium]
MRPCILAIAFTVGATWIGCAPAAGTSAASTEAEMSETEMTTEATEMEEPADTMTAEETPPSTTAPSSAPVDLSKPTDFSALPGLSVPGGGLTTPAEATKPSVVKITTVDFGDQSVTTTIMRNLNDWNRDLNAGDTGVSM